ncbi:hypothetical protein IMG5_165500 [Ichthyophthirius multifiliis]|uniref:DHHA1 domain-containing protein n=1 Tax=Ichthyophthirius multifiliis TaxID=5932 RepID=G0R0L9_ICHMU|nr:hypothetical protein IMG5_165500 [Ichthyophthirius multifiliis]EGR29005.1 hypothetical protein IMG5_165500 [Ichthyophthirius multifiliis]|eukprot:XP_004030241.1 hypothetical protein IMG5_165500 [Ichthyophthirius multifiliis]
MNTQLFENIQKISKLVEFYDIKKEINQNAEAFVSNIFSHKYDFDKFSFFIGGQTNCIAKGYAVVLDNPELTNDLGYQLALLSFQDGMDNVGIIIVRSQKNKNRNNNVIKVSLRADNKKESKCNFIAEQFNGGGHAAAAGFYIENKFLQQWKK